MIVLVILTVPIVKERLLLVEPAMLELLSECAPRMYCVMTRGTTSRAVDSVRFDQRNRMNHMHNILAYVMS